jgi:hypothetical protein
MSHRPVTIMRAPIGDARSPVLQGFPCPVTVVTDVTDNIITHMRARAHARARPMEFEAGDIGALGDIGDSAQHVGSFRRGCVGGPLSPAIRLFEEIPDSTFARVP